MQVWISMSCLIYHKGNVVFTMMIFLLSSSLLREKYGTHWVKYTDVIKVFKKLLNCNLDGAIMIFDVFTITIEATSIANSPVTAILCNIKDCAVEI